MGMATRCWASHSSPVSSGTGFSTISPLRSYICTGEASCLKYLSIARAPRRPAAIASMIMPGPVTKSPPAKTPGRLVARVLLSTTRVSHRVRSRALSAGRKERSGAWPTAAITVSASMKVSEPSIGMGRRRPLSSGSPSFIWIHCNPDTFQPSVTIRVGLTRKLILTPSARVWSYSTSVTGISARERR